MSLRSRFAGEAIPREARDCFVATLLAMTNSLCHPGKGFSLIRDLAKRFYFIGRDCFMLIPTEKWKICSRPLGLVYLKQRFPIFSCVSKKRKEGHPKGETLYWIPHSELTASLSCGMTFYCLLFQTV